MEVNIVDIIFDRVSQLTGGLVVDLTTACTSGVGLIFIYAGFTLLMDFLQGTFSSSDPVDPNRDMSDHELFLWRDKHKEGSNAWSYYNQSIQLRRHQSKRNL